MGKKLVFTFDDDRDDSGLRIFMMPYIVNTNIKIPLRIEHFIEINDKITGINGPNRQENYTSKKIKQRNYALAYNAKNPKEKHMIVPVINRMFHSISVIIKVPISEQTSISMNVSIFTSGTFKVTSSSNDIDHSILAVRILCDEILRVAKKNNIYSNEPDDRYVYHATARQVIDSFIHSKSTNQPLWKWSIDTEEACTEIKNDIKDAIRTYNVPNRHYNPTKKSLQGLLGLTPDTNYTDTIVVFGAFPTLIRAQTQMKYKINCKEVYVFLIKNKYATNYQPHTKAKVSISFPVLGKHIMKVDINPTGMITFMTKTKEELKNLYKTIMELLEKNKKAFANVDTTFGDSSDSS
jgi:hypothetical protein